jgi:putative ABC transport system permease protein
MKWFTQLFSRRRLYGELSEEIQEHLYEKIEEFVASGMSRKDAAAAARREFGNVTLIEEDSRTVWRWPSVEGLLSDIRYALRQLRKNPGFTGVIVLTFALCIGVNTVNFSLADAIFLRPLRFVPHSDRMVRVAGVHSDGFHFLMAPANFADFQSQSRSFESLEAYIDASRNLGGDSAPERLDAAKVTSGFFRMLGATPLFGREFLPGDYQAGRPAAMLSYNLWQRLGGDSKIVGQPIRLEGQPTIVVGVMPKSFDFPAATQIWLPLVLEPSDLNDRLTRRLSVAGILKEGVSLRQAQADVSGIAARIGQSYPGPEKLVGADVTAIRDVINGNLTPIFISTMIGAMGFLLLLGCVNVAGMQLSRAAARQHEIALRTALGASRGRVVRQLLTESLLLSFFGGIAGLLAARGGVVLLSAAMPADKARQIAGWNVMRVDSHALLFAVFISALAGLASGLVPSLESSRPSLNHTLKSGATIASSTGRTQRLRSLLVVAEVALALTLVIGAGLEARAFRNTLTIAKSFEPSTLLTIRIELPESRYATPEKQKAYYTAALSKIALLPGVTEAGIFNAEPFSNNGPNWDPFLIEGQAAPLNRQAAVIQNTSPGFFSLLKIPLRGGRDFEPTDRSGTLPVAIVSGRFARAHWPGEDPLGKHLRLGKPESSGPWLTVVGVAGDVQYDWTDDAPEPVIYIPYLQSPSAKSILALRTVVDPLSLTKPLRCELLTLDPDLPVLEMATLERVMLTSMAPLLILGSMMGVIGLVGLILAAVGVYGVMAYNVSQRTQEIGIRISLGAEHPDVLKLVVGRAAWITLLGVTAGLAGTLLMSPLLSSFFFGVSPTDPATYLTVALLLLAVALLASYFPAQRAMRVDPMVALRYE